MKNYPRRIEKEPTKCECGHYDFWHEITIYRFYYTLFGLMGNVHGKCELCMCPRFEEEKHNE